MTGIQCRKINSVEKINLQGQSKQNKVESKIYPVQKYPKCLKGHDPYKSLAMYNTTLLMFLLKVLMYTLNTQGHSLQPLILLSVMQIAKLQSVMFTDCPK